MKDKSNLWIAPLFGLVGLGLYLIKSLLNQPVPLERLSFSPHRLPGLRISLPVGKFGQNKTDSTIGKIQINQPGKNQLTVVLEWKPGTAFTPEEFKILAEELKNSLDPNGRVSEAIPISVANHTGYRMKMYLPKMRMVITNWYCPEYGRTLSLWVGGVKQLPEIEKLQDRILATVVCHTEKALKETLEEDLLSRNLPKMNLDGYGFVENSDPLGFATLNGDVLYIQIERQAQGLDVTKDKKYRTLMKNLMTSMARSAGGEIEWLQTTQSFQGPGNTLQPLWTFRITENDETQIGALTWFGCADGSLFQLMYFPPEKHIHFESLAQTVFKKIQCWPNANPQKNPNIKKFNTMAQAACLQGDSRGCTLLAGMLLERDPRNAQVEKLLKTACRLNDGDACNEWGHQILLQDPEKVNQATIWFQTACEKDSAVGCFNFGMMHQEKNSTIANVYYDKACQMGYVQACQPAKDLSD